MKRRRIFWNVHISTFVSLSKHILIIYGKFWSLNKMVPKGGHQEGGKGAGGVEGDGVES